MVAQPLPDPTGTVFTGAASFREALGLIAKLARVGAHCLIWGESGTGKNLLAYLSHTQGPRRDRPYVEISCSSLPESLVETELFGYVRGAFTGAESDHPGRLALAGEGTLVLDELEQLSLPAQAKLLRVVETGCYSPVGTTSVHAVGARFVGITQEPPEDLVRRGVLRADLYYRLATFTVPVPSLRNWEREAFDGLVHFLAGAEAERVGTSRVSVPGDVLAILRAYGFPGNVRELQNLLRRVTILRPGGTLTSGDLPDHVREASEGWPTLASVERDYIARVLAHTGGGKQEAARILGIHRKTLLEKRKLYGLDASPETREAQDSSPSEPGRPLC